VTHVITSLCLRDSACVNVCPVDCIVPGKPEDAWPWFYIDADTCIDCGACIPECPFEAIFPEDGVPGAYTMKAGQQRTPAGGQRYTAGGGEVVDLSGDIAVNTAFFKQGPGYRARG
jgi:ferredoxin